MKKITVARAFYLPPATGFRQSLDDEFAILRQMKISAEVISPVEIDPALTKMARGLANPLGEIAYWKRYVEIVENVILSGIDVQTPIFIVGFNLGGSLAAYSATTISVSGLIIAGSIPRLTEFWANSEHPVAASARAAAAASALPNYCEKLRPYDLTSSLNGITIPVLLQFGNQDEWIDRSQVDELESLASSSMMIKWYEDGHDMAMNHCFHDRCQFLAQHI